MIYYLRLEYYSILYCYYCYYCFLFQFHHSINLPKPSDKNKCGDIMADIVLDAPLFHCTIFDNKWYRNNVGDTISRTGNVSIPYFTDKIPNNETTNFDIAINLLYIFFLGLFFSNALSFG